MAVKKTVAPEVVEEVKETTLRKAAKNEPTANGLRITEVLDRIRTIADNNQKQSVNGMLVSVLGIRNWSYDYDKESGYGTLVIKDDEGREIAKQRYPADTFKNALNGAFRCLFGFILPDERKVEEPKKETQERVVEEEPVPTPWEEPPVIQQAEPVVEPRIPISDGNYGRNGHYPSPDSLPNKFTDNVTLLSKFQPCFDETGRVAKGYGAKVQVKGNAIFLRYWVNSGKNLNTDYLQKIAVGTTLPCQLRKYVTKSGEVQLILEGWG